MKKRRYILVTSALFREDAINFTNHFRDLFVPVIIPAGELVRYGTKRAPVFIVAREARRNDPPLLEGEVYLEPREVLNTVPAGRRVWRRDRVRQVRGI